MRAKRISFKKRWSFMCIDSDFVICSKAVNSTKCYLPCLEVRLALQLSSRADVDSYTRDIVWIHAGKLLFGHKPGEPVWDAFSHHRSYGSASRTYPYLCSLIELVKFWTLPYTLCWIKAICLTKLFATKSCILGFVRALRWFGCLRGMSRALERVILFFSLAGAFSHWRTAG